MQTFDISAFNWAIHEAVEAAQVGFYFEEGACWGMAAALHSHFSELGLPVGIKFAPTGFIHVWVEVAGVSYDYRGEMTPLPGAVDLTPEELVIVTLQHGYDEEEFLCMTADATAIVKTAWDNMQANTLSLIS